MKPLSLALLIVLLSTPAATLARDDSSYTFTLIVVNGTGAPITTRDSFGTRRKTWCVPVAPAKIGQRVDPSERISFQCVVDGAYSAADKLLRVSNGVISCDVSLDNRIVVAEPWNTCNVYRDGNTTKIGVGARINPDEP